MTSPRDLAARIRAVAVGAVDDRAGFTSFTATLPDPEVRAWWLALREAPPPYLARVHARYEGSDLDAQAEPSADPVRIMLNKAAPAGALCFFLQDLDDRAWHEVEAAPAAVLVAELDPDQAFTTRRTIFAPWGDVVPELTPDPEPASPRRFVRDYTGQGSVPQDIRPWLLGRLPERGSRLLEAWRIACTPRLLASLVDSVSGSPDDLVYHLAGPSKRELRADARLQTMLPALQDAAAWVYLEGTDPEARYLLFAAEFARAHRSEVPSLAPVLEAAKVAYGAHLKSASRETLKALADLRKGVVEETQKAVQRSQDLTGALWKDLSVAAAPLVLKLFADLSKIESARTAAVLAVVAVGWLAFSYVFQLVINGRYFDQQRTARGIWRQSLSQHLTQQEIDDLSAGPIRGAEGIYNGARVAVGIVYLALVAMLLLFAWASWTGSASSPAGKEISNASAEAARVERSGGTSTATADVPPPEPVLEASAGRREPPEVLQPPRR